jgi:hypothetical protein
MANSWRQRIKRCHADQSQAPMSQFLLWGAQALLQLTRRSVDTWSRFLTALARAYAHYYTMDDVSGTTIADTGATAGSPGTYSLTGLTLNQIALRNDNEGCPIFDGASGYATIPDTTSTTGLSKTVAAGCIGPGTARESPRSGGIFMTVLR